VRVIAGELRGRRLVAPAGATTRPTSDRVREATFNALTSLDAIEDAIVLDRYAGTGALGIEALSRGASRCTFVEVDRAATAALRTNLERCGLGEDRAVVRATVPEGPWDLVLLDPPYAFDGWHELLGELAADLAPDALAVCESAGPVPLPEGWLVVREKAYGATVVTIVRHDPSPSGHPTPDPTETIEEPPA
jgi:16S rRNA (guanine966-N2)-methyltransferase